MCCYPEEQMSPTYLPGVMHQSRNSSQESEGPELRLWHLPSIWS